MRQFSLQMLSAMSAQETGEVILALITVSHPALPGALFFTSDSVPTVSQGNTFLPMPMLLSIPGDRADQLTQVKITIDNIDRSMIAAIRAIPVGSAPPSIVMQIVRAASPDQVEASFPFDLADEEDDPVSLTATLTYSRILDEPFPGDYVTPGTIPGAF